MPLNIVKAAYGSTINLAHIQVTLEGMIPTKKTPPQGGTSPQSTPLYLIPGHHRWSVPYVGVADSQFGAGLHEVDDDPVQVGLVHLVRQTGHQRLDRAESGRGGKLAAG